MTKAQIYPTRHTGGVLTFLLLVLLQWHGPQKLCKTHSSSHISSSRDVC